MIVTSRITVVCHSAPYQRPFDDTGIAVTATIIFTFLVIGLVGNGLTITVITFYDCLR